MHLVSVLLALIGLTTNPAQGTNGMNLEGYGSVSVGAEYEITHALALRAGFNKAKNPVPDGCLNALFPAIVEDHVALGWGYVFGNSLLGFGITMAFNKNSTNPGTGVTSGRKQINWQIMFDQNF
jgi:long-chain fatty acid transport protein